MKSFSTIAMLAALLMFTGLGCTESADTDKAKDGASSTDTGKDAADTDMGKDADDEPGLD